MSKLQSALEKNISGEFIDAVAEYEAASAAGETAPNLFIDLAFLYWAFATQLPFAPVVSNEWSKIGLQKWPETLERGLSLYPTSTEMRFWKKYFAHRAFFEDFPEEECKKLLKDGDESKVPYFYLWLFDHGKYAKVIEELLEEVKKEPTAKNRYIQSILTTRTIP